MQSLVREELKVEQFFVHNLFKHKKDVLIISKTTIAFFKSSTHLSSQHIKISYKKNTSHLLGIIISKKIVPLAVNRNRLRRILREKFRSYNLGPFNFAILLTITKIPAEKNDINDILLPEWISLLKQLER